MSESPKRLLGDAFPKAFSCHDYQAQITDSPNPLGDFGVSTEFEAPGPHDPVSDAGQAAESDLQYPWLIMEGRQQTSCGCSDEKDDSGSRASRFQAGVEAEECDGVEA